MSDVTHILRAIESGEPKAADELLPLVYDELRKLAVHRMSHEPPGNTLQPTAPDPGSNGQSQFQSSLHGWLFPSSHSSAARKK